MSFIKKRDTKDFDVIIGLDSSINGDIISSGSIRIDGSVSGSVKSQGDVIVGANAIVNSDVDAQYCEISGKVSGNVHSDSQLRIFKSGSLKGDITVSSFTIEEGGIFQGNCDINPDKKERKTDTKDSFNSESKKNESNDSKSKNNDAQDKKINVIK